MMFLPSNSMFESSNLRISRFSSVFSLAYNVFCVFEKFQPELTSQGVALEGLE